MDSVIRINNVLDNLEDSIEILLEAFRKKDSISLINNDIFKSIAYDIYELNKYDNKRLGESFTYYRFAISHLNKTFNNKESINKDDVDSVVECLNDIRILKMKLNINIPYYRFFNDLHEIVINLQNMNIDKELIYNSISSDTLKSYDSIIKKYHNVIINIDEISPYINNNIFKSLKLDLDINYSYFRDNLHQIYIQILNSNSDIADPILNKLRYYLNTKNYEAILKTNMVNKEINDSEQREYLSNKLNTSINSLTEIINRYQNILLEKRSNIDIELLDSNQNKDYGIYIPSFIEDNYEERRNMIISNNSNTSYNSKIASYIYKFEVLKNKLERKKSLTKEDVKLYNKIESELDIIKRHSNSFMSGIRFNYYSKKLNKNIRLYRKSSLSKVK